MSRAALNAQLFNQAVSLGLSPNFTGKPGKGRRTNYLQNLIASYRPPAPTPAPTPPPPPPPAPAPVKTKKDKPRIKLKKSRRESLGIGKRSRSQTRVPLNTGGGSTGGINL